MAFISENIISEGGITGTTISGGTYYGNGLPLTKVNNIITVGLSGINTDYSTIKSAVDSITNSSSANTYTIKVAGGIYYEDPFTIPTWVSVVGSSSLSTIIQANDSSQTLIKLSDQSALFDCQVQGCTGTGVSAIIYSSSTTPQSLAISYVENVRFGSNYTNAKVVASGGANIIMQCSNVKYGGYPFTVGFYATNDGSGIGRMQLRNVTSTNGGIVTTSGLIFAKADAASCGFIVNGCLLTKAAGAAAGTGFYVENGGFLRLTAVNFQRWAVGIDAPQIGSAPSIDAIALNFENNTIDVNIAHSGATGKIQGTDTYTKTNINIDAPLYEVNQDPRIITVAKKGGDFTSVKSAVDSLTATSLTSRYVVKVGPGIFKENEIDLTNKPYVSIIGSDIQATIIQPLTNTQNIFSLGTDTELSFMTISGASSGYAGISCVDLNGFALVHKLSMYDNDTHILVDSSNADSTFYGEYVDLNGNYTYGTKVASTNGYTSLANMENYYNFPSSNDIVYCNYATGSGSTLSIFVGDNQSNGVSGSTAFYAQDGAGLYCSTITIDGFTYGIRNPNIGDPIRFDIDNASIVSGEWDLYVERIGTFGTFGGSASHAKLYSISSDVYWSFLDIEDGELDITRKASVTFSDGTHTDFTTLIFEGSSMGLISGGTLTTISGTTIQADGGFGYVEKSDNSGIVRRIDWLNNQLTLSANTDNYIFINENGNLGTSGTRPDSFYNIILGRVVTNSTEVSFIDLTPFNAQHSSNRFGSLFREALGPIYANGSIVTEGTAPFTLNVSEGEYYFSTTEITPTGGTGITFNQYYRTGTGSTWVTSATTLVNHTQFDNNGTLSGLTSGYYTKHTLYLVGDGTYEKYFLVLGQNQYSTLVATEDALLPTPPTYFTDSVVQVANIYIQQGTSGITQIEDIRPVIGFKAGGVNASSVHGNLLGLAADDHTQYLLVNGGRAMSGDLSLGGNSLTNILTANGVTIESHATRHQFGGADPVGSTTPSPNAIPYADVSGTLDSWVSTATTTTLGRVKLSTTPVSSSDPIVIGDNDIRVSRSLTGGTYSNGTATFTNNTGGTITLTGLTTTNGSSPQVGYFSSGTNLTGSNNFVYSGGTLQLNATGSTSSAVPLRLRNSSDNDNIAAFSGNGAFKIGLESGYHISLIPSSPSLRGQNAGSVNWQLSPWTGEHSWITNNATNQNLVGIGTSSPTDKLHVYNTINDYRIKVAVGAGTPSDESCGIKFTTTWAGTSFGSNAAEIVARTKGTNTIPSQKSSLEFQLNSGGTTSVRGSITSQSNLLLQNPTEDTNDVGVIYVLNGVVPTGSTTNGYKQYSSDIVAGKAAPHFRTEDGDIVKLYTHSAVTTTQGIANALTTLGLLSASTISIISTDVFVTGATYSNNTFTYTNNTGGTFNVNFNTLTGVTVTGTSNLNGDIVSTNLSGSTDRLVQVSSGGTFSASQDIIQAYIDPLGSVATLLGTTSNWDINGVYIGSTITGTYQGQKHYNSNYFFEAVDDNLWIRLIRG